MSSSTIAIVLFIILCPCVSYIVVKKRLVPWSGGVFLLVENDALIPVRWGRPDWGIGSKTIVKGFFLPGAKPWALPQVTIRGPYFNDKEKGWSISYWYAESENGVYVMLNKQLESKDIKFFVLDVTSTHPWKGGEFSRVLQDKFYYRHIGIHFTDKVEPFG